MEVAANLSLSSIFPRQPQPRQSRGCDVEGLGRA